MPAEHVDVLIIGAGISGIDAAYRLQERCPERSYAVFEARNQLGGTWDLVRYPGIRSDSDMYTLGFPFRPWTGEKAIVEGAQILEYLKDTAREFGITRHIRLRHRVLSADWSSTEARWTVEYETHGSRSRLTCNFLFMASGYYDYTQGYQPEFAGIRDYRGQIVHPQQWPPDLQYADKRIVVIGSGATAISLVPALAQRAAHVTLLQRSPTYIVTLPTRDQIADGAFRVLPHRFAAGLVRWKNIALSMFFYQLARRRPQRVRRLILDGVRRQLPECSDLDRHFDPPYNPWDQRLCVAADGDFFAALRSGRVEMVTDTIETFISTGLKLTSGRQLEADLVVTATGFRLQLLGNVKVMVDGERLEASRHTIYRGMLVDDVPNLVLAFGYTNASWTLRVDLVSRYFCRLLNYMKRRQAVQFRPQRPSSEIEPRPLLNLTSGYIRRSATDLPKQGSKAPWRVHQNYILDLTTLQFGRVDDGVLEFRAAQDVKSECRAN